MKKEKLKDYVSADKKFCQSKCNREKIGNVLVCHGCKRILFKLK